ARRFPGESRFPGVAMIGFVEAQVERAGKMSLARRSSSVKNSNAVVWQGLKVGSAYSFSPAFEAYSAKSLRFRALAYEPSSVSAWFMVACSSA
ncbi:MAG TPA: hypothetical protein VHF86_09970, partial [Xanthomonadaceae bacterium]|nr:hypothetical protein [Xanthomonadaceae bacterium]